MQLPGVTVGTRAQACYSISLSDTQTGTDRRRLYTEHRFWSPTARVQMLALSVTGCVIFSKSINLSVPLLAHPQIRIIITPTLEGCCGNEVNSYVLSIGH